MLHEEEKKQYVLHIQQSWARVIFFSTCKRLQVILFYPVCHASPRCFSLSPIVTVSHKSIFLKCTYKFFTASSIFETQAHLAQPHTNLYGGQSPPPSLVVFEVCKRGFFERGKIWGEGWSNKGGLQLIQLISILNIHVPGLKTQALPVLHFFKKLLMKG